MASEPVIGWDVGGAHLKAARVGAGGRCQEVFQEPCPLWRGLDELDAALDRILAAAGSAPRHAVTMTGELVDCFPDRASGVAALVGVLRRRLPEADLRFYAGREGFLPAAAAASHPSVASANWAATASVVAARVGSALLVDIGSTTTDLVPVVGGQVAARAWEDGTRLAAGELLYTGVVRTPLMALAERVPFDGDWVPLMAEHFATTADIYRIGGLLPEEADRHPAADSGEKTVAGSARRLARMVGRDAGSAPLQAWRELAAWLAREQQRRIGDACARLLSRHEVPLDAPLVGAGVGRFLLAEIGGIRGRAAVDFGTLIPAEEAVRSRLADHAPAVSVAWLLAADS